MDFIHHNETSKNKKVVSIRIVYIIRPQKVETHKTGMTIGGNILDYEGKTKAPTDNLTTMKLLLNSALSTPGDKFMTIDINHFYLKQN